MRRKASSIGAGWRVLVHVFLIALVVASILPLYNVIAASFKPPRPLEAAPEAIPLDVLFEDDDLIVVNKPAGVVVHPAAGNADSTGWPGAGSWARVRVGTKHS